MRFMHASHDLPVQYALQPTSERPISL